MPAARRRRGAALGVLVVVGIVVASTGLLFVSGPAIAGDAIAQFDLASEERAADPGDTVTVDVVLRSDGGYAGEGVESYSFVVAVPPEVGEPTSVDPGPWLAQDGGSVNQTVTDAGDGAIQVQHRRVGAQDGVTGADVAATVTIALREDAPAADATVLVADPEAHLDGSDFRMRTFGDEATIVMAGGGDRLEPAYEPGQSMDGGSVPVTTANESNRTVDPESGGSGDGGDDPTPGPGIGLGVLAVVVGMLLAAVVGTASVADRR